MSFDRQQTVLIRKAVTVWALQQLHQLHPIDHDLGHLDPNFLSLEDVVQDLYCADPTQETWSR